jgi:hypothetical protein
VTESFAIRQAIYQHWKEIQQQKEAEKQEIERTTETEVYEVSSPVKKETRPWVLKKKDFVFQREGYSSNRKGEREYLKKSLTKDMMMKLNSFFESTVEIPRVKHGNKQTIETLINEVTLLLAMFLRNEKQSWKTRMPI